jgi:2-methylisocitrate lyase-like PEP mutase family enzyme
MQVRQLEKAKRFKELHTREGCFLMPNAWDAGSAKMLATAGFSAIATTSAGVAFSMGRPDHGFCSADARVGRYSMLARVESMASAVAVPLNADLEAGYGMSPESVAETISKTIAAGAAGGNIEDFTGDKSNPLFESPLAVDRIRAAREAINQSGIPFVLTARADCYLVGHPDAFAESVRRANLFREAGADCLFVPGVSDSETIGRLVAEINGPINIVMGLTGNALSLADLKALGVRRISIGGSLARAMYYHIQQAAREMIEQGTFSYADKQIPQWELNQIFDR